MWKTMWKVWKTKQDILGDGTWESILLRHLNYT